MPTGLHIFGVLLITISSVFAAGQAKITLADAVAMALEKNPAHKAAIAERSAASAAAKETRAMLLPRLSFAESATRGNDPVFAFGTRLRQQRFTANDFALNRLNLPTPIGDFSTRFGGQWTVFDSFQNVRQVRRAQLGEQAAQKQLDRTDQEVLYRVVEAYYAALLASREVEVAEASLRTAQALEERGHVRVTSGVAVESDYLTAQTQTAVRRQDLIRAKDGLSLARASLAIAAGMPADTPLDPVDARPDHPIGSLALAELEERAFAHRPDLLRVGIEETAQQMNVSAAKSAYGPRVNAFGSWQTNSPSMGWNGGNNWVAGMEVQLDLFDGGARHARLAREKANAERVAAMREMLRDRIRLEVRSAYYDLDAARQQVEVARASIANANESLRINQDRYDSGLSTVTELLRIEEAAHRAQTDYWDAVYRVQTGAARLELATGTLNENSAVVKP